MNLQALMKQAQNMQKNMLEQKKEIEKKTFVGKSELVEITINGKREVIDVKIKVDSAIENDDKEILQDMILLAMNDAIKQVDKEIENKLGSQMGQFGGLL